MFWDPNSFCSLTLECPKLSKSISRWRLLAEQTHYKSAFLQNAPPQLPNLIVQKLLLCHLDSLREILHEFYIMQSAFLFNIYELNFTDLKLNSCCMSIFFLLVACFPNLLKMLSN